jgi:hypothetical protein
MAIGEPCLIGPSADEPPELTADAIWSAVGLITAQIPVSVRVMCERCGRQLFAFIMQGMLLCPLCMVDAAIERAALVGSMHVARTEYRRRCKARKRRGRR